MSEPVTNPADLTRHSAAKGVDPRPEDRLRPVAIAVGFGVLCVSYLLNAMDRQVFYPLLPQIREEFAFSLEQSGLLATGFTLGLALTGIPASYVIDRLSRRAVLVISIVVYSLGTLAIPLASGFVDMAVYRVISGIGEGVQATVLYTVVGSFFFHRRALAAGVVGVTFGIGVFLGPLLGNKFAAFWGDWRAPFVAFGVAGLAMAVLARLAVPRQLTEAVTVTKPGSESADFTNVPARVVNLNSVALAIACTVTGLMFYGFLGLYPTYLAEELGFTPGQIALAASFVGFGAVTALIAGWLGDLVSQPLLLAVGFLGSSASSFAIYHLATSPAAQYVLAFSMGAFASGILFTNCTTALQRAVRPEFVSRAAGAFVLSFYGASVFSGLLFARLVAVLGWSSAALWQLTLLPLVGVVAVACVRSERMVLPPRRSSSARRRAIRRTP